ncbi:hypothetical protein KH5_23380 [Urechidicola sp. KH5]
MKKLTLVHLFFAFTISLIAQKNRPQEPKEPFNYTIEEVVLNNTKDGVKLAGTLTYPTSGTNYPAVLLISGSGAQDRNSELMQHKPFLVIADYLTTNGIAVLRVDDRGIGESEGNYNNSTLEEFVNDNQSALNFLKSHKKINPEQIGLIGHSLGGNIAPILASKNKDVAFIILLAASGIKGDELMLLQKAKIERKMGASEIAITMGQTNMKGAYDIILKSENNTSKLQDDLEVYFTKISGGLLPKNQIQGIAMQLSLPWLVDFIKLDPKTALNNTNCPVLALNGTNDLQVPAEENLSAIEKALNSNGNKEVTIKEFENLNHLFQKSETGLPNEYGSIEQTFAPEVLEFMSEWILLTIK